MRKSELGNSLLECVTDYGAISEPNSRADTAITKIAPDLIAVIASFLLFSENCATRLISKKFDAALMTSELGNLVKLIRFQRDFDTETQWISLLYSEQKNFLSNLFFFRKIKNPFFCTQKISAITCYDLLTKGDSDKKNALIESYQALLTWNIASWLEYRHTFIKLIGLLTLGIAGSLFGYSCTMPLNAFVFGSCVPADYQFHIFCDNAFSNKKTSIGVNFNDTIQSCGFENYTQSVLSICSTIHCIVGSSYPKFLFGSISEYLAVTANSLAVSCNIDNSIATSKDQSITLIMSIRIISLLMILLVIGLKIVSDFFGQTDCEKSIKNQTESQIKKSLHDAISFIKNIQRISGVNLGETEETRITETVIVIKKLRF